MVCDNDFSWEFRLNLVWYLLMVEWDMRFWQSNMGQPEVLEVHGGKPL